MYSKEPDFGHLKKLWTLRAVVDAGSLKRASIRTKVSVSAVSQSISGLERKLGRKLFIKKDRHLEATQYCLELLGSVEPAFRVFSELDRVQAGPACVPPMAWLDFGTSHCVAAEILPRLVRRLKEKLPELKLKLKVATCSTLHSQVKRGELCMALVAGDGDPKDVASYPIYEDRLGIFEAAGEPPRPSSRAVRPFATLAPDSDGLPSHHARFLRALDGSWRSTIACDHYETLYDLAASGATPAFLPERIALRVPGVLRRADSPKSLDAGRFTVRMISQSGCDPREDRFLIDELRGLI